MRGSGPRIAAAAAAVAVLALLGLVALAARSDRAGTVTAVAPPTTGSRPAPTAGPYKQPDNEVDRGVDTSGGEMPIVLVTVVCIALAALALAAAMGWSVAVRPALELPKVGGTAGETGGATPAPDSVDAARLAAAVRAALRQLEDGGPGEGVIACWVLLERAAADAGTHRIPPDTPSELAGRLIDRHDVSPAPLLRLARLYREARYSRHVLPESARSEARAALGEVAAELARRPIGSVRTGP